MNHDWDFRSHGQALADLDNTPPPTPKRMRKLLRREEETLARVVPDAATRAAATDHDVRGRFTKGNKAGTGNPFARQTAAFRAVLMQTVTEEDVAVVVRAVLAKAQAGDVAAAKLLFSYLMGKPTDAPDPDRLELDDWKLLKERLTPLKEDWQQLKEIVPVEGLVEAGHRVADLRATSWRAEVLPPAEPTWCDTAERLPADVTAAAVEAGVAELIAMYHEERGRECKRPDAVAPSPNGAHGVAAPSPNGYAAAQPPSTNGRNGQPAPAPNGKHGPAAPSPNGFHGPE